LKVGGGNSSDSQRIGGDETLKGETAVKQNYHVLDQNAKEAERNLESFCRANGQILLPLVELIEQAR
jgi:hypothetical protein